MCFISAFDGDRNTRWNWDYLNEYCGYLNARRYTCNKTFVLGQMNE